MATKMRPITPAQRGMVAADFSAITKKKPEKSLTRRIKRTGGRNNLGKLTVRHKGGGAKRLFRDVDFVMDYEGKAKVLSVEYDPYRSAYITLLELEESKDKKYIVAPQGVTVGAILTFGPDAEIKPGNRLPLRNIPVGTTIYNIELKPGRGGQLARSAGTSVQLMAKEEKYVQIKLPSGEVRKVPADGKASIGASSNAEHGILKIGKAGRKRHMGIRPTVRGSAMDPTAHPHGGGEGKSPIGMPGPKTPWGKPALGRKTRKPKYSDILIVRRRTKKSRKR